MSDPILGPTEVWDTDALTELEDRVFGPAGFKLPRPFRCRTGAVQGTKGTSRKVLSFYLSPELTEDGVGQYYTSAFVGDSRDAILLLVRMVTEAVSGQTAWHTGTGRKVVPTRRHNLAWLYGIKPGNGAPVPEVSPGLEGANLEQAIADILAALGPRPHGAVVLPEQIRKPKNTALCKAFCPYCAQPMRATMQALERAWPVCVGASRPIPHEPVFLVAQVGTAKLGFVERRADAYLSDHTRVTHNADGYPAPVI